MKLYLVCPSHFASEQENVGQILFYFNTWVNISIHRKSDTRVTLNRGTFCVHAPLIMQGILTKIFIQKNRVR